MTNWLSLPTEDKQNIKERLEQNDSTNQKFT